jgi:hypothetical protein
MMKQLLRVALCGAVLGGTAPAGSCFSSARAQTASVQAYNAEQLDALLAPIALYPDALLAQVLMASTFPVQVVSAGRWIDDAANKSLSGDALAKALEPQTWDPSVKSLVPFPSVLALMNSHLEWTQQVGYAFAEQQADAMNSVQRLRFHAQGAGNLKTTEQQIVRVESQTIIIEPAQPTVVYVPSYNPTVVYGAWPYRAYPPVYLPPPPGYVFGAVVVSGIAFAAGVAVVGSLWGWARPGWGTGYVNVNVNNYNNINVNRTQINSNVWQPNRPGGRPAGLARAPNGPVGQPGRPRTLPANTGGRPNGAGSSGNVAGSGVNRPQSRSGTAAITPASRPNAGQANRPQLGQGTANRPNGRTPPAAASAAGSPQQRPARPAAGAGQRPAAGAGQPSAAAAGQQRGAASRVAAQGQTNARPVGKATPGSRVAQ